MEAHSPLMADDGLLLRLWGLLPFPADPSPMEELTAWALTTAAGSQQPAAGTPKATWPSTSVASSSPVAVGTQIQPQILSIMPPQLDLLALSLQPPAQPKATHVPKIRSSTLPPHSAATQPTLLERIDTALESDTDETARRQPTKPLSRSKRESPHVSDSPSRSDQDRNLYHEASDVARSDEEEDDEIRGGKSDADGQSDSDEEYVPGGDGEEADSGDGERCMDGNMDAIMDTRRKRTRKRGTTGSEVLSTVTRIRKPVGVPAPRTVHASWGDWMKYMQTYMAATQQVLAVKTTLNCKLRNKRLSETVADQEGRDVPYVPEDMVYYERCYICTHGWTKKSRSTDVRPRQFTRGSKCPFRFIVQLEQDGDEWRLAVKNGVFAHNHALEKRNFTTYASSRGIEQAENKTAVKEMVTHGRKRSVIYDFLLGQGENVIQKDVDNIVQMLQAERADPRDDDDACAVLLAKFASVEGNVVTVDETDAGETGVISLSSRHMRTVFSRFPELLLVDCTHKTNRSNYQLCTLMGIDENGEGQPVQQSVLERNADWHIRIFHARILICVFHVIKYLRLASRKPEYGKISSDDHETIDTLVHNLVYAQSEEVYENERSALRWTCKSVGSMPFFDYMEKNWHSCTDMWVAYKRAKLPHFRVHTNNHLESWFGKFKGCVKSAMKLAQTMEELVGYDRRLANEYQHKRNRIGFNTNVNYDEEMSEVLMFTNHFVAGRVEQQYAMAVSKVNEFDYVVDAADERVTVIGAHKSHEVDLRTWHCTCSFANAMKLPCQHAMAYRRWKNPAGVCIPKVRIDARYVNMSMLCTSHPCQVNTTFMLSTCATILLFVRRDRWINADDVPTPSPAFKFNVFETATPQNKSLSKNQKYKSSLSAMQAICGELADIDDDSEFRAHLEFLIGQWRNIRQRKRLKVISSTTSELKVKPPEGVGIVDVDGDGDWDGDSLSGSRSSPKRETGDEAGDGNQTKREPPSQASDLSLLSQPHSLYSEDLGDVLMMSSKNVDFAPGKAQATKVKRPTRSSVTENVRVNNNEGTSDDDFLPRKQHPFKICINPRAAKSVRPRLDKKQQVAEVLQQRVRFNAAEKHRRSLGDATLTHLAKAIQDEKPGVLEALKRVTPIPVKFKHAVNKRPKFQQEQKPVLNAAAFYLLPKALLKRCCKVMPANDECNPIIVDGSQSEHDGAEGAVTHGPDSDSHGFETGVDAPNMDAIHEPDRDKINGPDMEGKVDLKEIVRIPGIGAFDRQQIEAMLLLPHLQEDSEFGRDFLTWMRQVAAGAVPADAQRAVLATANAIEMRYPYENVSGVSSRCQYASIYRVMPPRWFDNALIAAFCERLCQNHGGVHYAGVADGKPNSRNSKQQQLPKQITDSAAALLAAVVAREEAVGPATETDTTTTGDDPGGEEQAPSEVPKKEPTQAQAEEITERHTNVAAEGYVSVAPVILAATTTSILLIPVNFGNYHWCCIITDMEKRRILYYDSLAEREALVGPRAQA
ncbi:hypothetical protein BBJ28_00019803 [Nothophytophthora sp. Chile5]|nr:hypothetical protein BBJ28_00019803 [Nothophytophthora sp. Chile5]